MAFILIFHFNVFFEYPFHSNNLFVLAAEMDELLRQLILLRVAGMAANFEKTYQQETAQATPRSVPAPAAAKEGSSKKSKEKENCSIL